MPSVSVSVDRGTIAEGAPRSSEIDQDDDYYGPTSDATFTVTRSTKVGTATVGIDWDKGTADSSDVDGQDMSVEFEEGEDSKAIKVHALNDETAEPPESLVAMLQGGSDKYFIDPNSPPKAQVNILDIGVMHLKSHVLSNPDPTAKDEITGTSKSTAISAFHIDVYQTNIDGTSSDAQYVNSQTYTVKSTAGSIESVSDSLGRDWTINGSTAVLKITDKTLGRSFDVSVTTTITHAGPFEVELDGQATRDPSAFFTKSSSSGRAIRQVANPGPKQNLLRIYYIIDKNAVSGNGHGAVLIPNGNGFTYYSYAMDGGVTMMDFNNIDDALAAAKAAGYTDYEYFIVSQAQADAASTAAAAYQGRQYNVVNCNCWNMCFAALSAAGTQCVDWGSSPNANYKNNESVADASGPLN